MGNMRGWEWVISASRFSMETCKVQLVTKELCYYEGFDFMKQARFGAEVKRREGTERKNQNKKTKSR